MVDISQMDPSYWLLNLLNSHRCKEPFLDPQSPCPATILCLSHDLSHQLLELNSFLFPPFVFPPRFPPSGFWSHRCALLTSPMSVRFVIKWTSFQASFYRTARLHLTLTHLLCLKVDAEAVLTLPVVPLSSGRAHFSSFLPSSPTTLLTAEPRPPPACEMLTRGGLSLGSPPFSPPLRSSQPHQSLPRVEYLHAYIFGSGVPSEL